MELPAFTMPFRSTVPGTPCSTPSASPRTCLALASNPWRRRLHRQLKIELGLINLSYRGQARHVTDNADLCDRYRPTFLRTRY
jgi:hypothetical protein